MRARLVVRHADQELALVGKCVSNPSFECDERLVFSRWLLLHGVSRQRHAESRRYLTNPNGERILNLRSASQGFTTIHIQRKIQIDSAAIGLKDEIERVSTFEDKVITQTTYTCNATEDHELRESLPCFLDRNAIQTRPGGDVAM